MKIQLPDVTLIAYSCIKIPETIWAIQKSCKNINFGSVKLISDKKPDNLPDFITWEFAPTINHIDNFNEYFFRKLYKHVDTEYCLTIQYHAWIATSSLWTNEFLNYDYCGAPWKIIDGAYMANDGTRSRVGNGGLSMRSKRLLSLPEQKGWNLRSEQGWKNEDGNICCYYKKEFLEEGIKYAPVELAAQFSYENPVPENQGVPSFGFHKFMNPANKGVL